MSLWYSYSENATDIDYESGDVDIWLGDDYNGNIYLSIPIADIKVLAGKIAEHEKEVA